MNKLIVLVVVGVILLLGINMYEKKLGRQCAILASILVIVVCGYFGYTLLNNNENFLDSHRQPPLERRPPNLPEQDLEPFQVQQDDLAAQEAQEAAQQIQEQEQAAKQQAQQVAQQAQQQAQQAQQAQQPVQPQDNSPQQASVEATVTEQGESGQLKVGSLLPAANSLWNSVVPSSTGDINVNSQLNAAFFIGTNTVGSSLRNASYDLRATPANPQGVGPCPETTIGPDLMRRSLESCS